MSGFKPPGLGSGLTGDQENTLEHFEYNPTTDQLEADVSIETTPNSVLLGGAWSVNSAGESLGAKNLSQDIIYRIHVSEMGDSINPTLIKERPSAEFIAQPIDTDLLVNPNYSIVIPVVDVGNPEDGQTSTTVKIKADPSSVLNNINIEYKINGINFATENIDLIPLGGNLYQIIYEFPIDIDVGDLIEATITSEDGDVIWLGDNTIGVPYLEPTVILWDRKEVAFGEDLSNKLETVSTDSTINGDGTSGDPLSVANEFTSADKAKLDNIEALAEVNQTDAEIKTQYENNTNTNAFTDAEQTKLSGLTGGRYLGVFADLTALQTAHPTAVSGDTATVTSPNSNMFYWNVSTWADSGTGYVGDMLKSVYDPTAINASSFARANHTGTQAASTISDFDTEVSSNSDVAANTAKVTNATHTGEVTGSGVLTMAPTAISNKTLITAASGMEVLINDAGTLKKVDTSEFLGGGIMPSLTYTTNANVDSLNVSSIAPNGILFLNIATNKEFRSLANGIDKQKITVVNLATQTIKIKNETGTGQMVRVEGSADRTLGNYGGFDLIYHASTGYWYVSSVIS